MCSLEKAIETMDKSVLVSNEVFKILVDEYRNAHTEDAVTALLDEQDIGVASEEDIIIAKTNCAMDLVFEITPEHVIVESLIHEHGNTLVQEKYMYVNGGKYHIERTECEL